MCHCASSFPCILSLVLIFPLFFSGSSFIPSKIKVNIAIVFYVLFAERTRILLDTIWDWFKVTLDDEGMFWDVSMRRILVLCISNFQPRKPNNCWLWKYKFGVYLLQTSPVYNELMTIYIPQEKQKKYFLHIIISILNCKHTKPCALAFYFLVVILIFGVLFRTV